MNLVVHIGVVVLIYIFTLQISKDKNVSLISGLIFVAHPLHVESVSFIAAITDPITALFMLITCILFGKFLSSRDPDKKRVCYIVSLISFVFALLSKEMGVTLPILLCLYEYIYLKIDDKNIIPSTHSFIHHIPFFLILGIYLIIRGMILDPITNTTGMTLYNRMLNVPYLIAGYIKLLFFPANLSMLRTIPIAKGLFDPIFYIPVIILTSIGLLIIKTYRYMIYLVFLLIWFFITLMPVVNIIPMPYPALFDRFVYIPSIGFTILIGLIIGKLIRLEIIRENIIFRYCILVSLSLIIIFFSITSIRRTFVWKNDLTLWSDSVKKSPDSRIAHINLGYYYDRTGDIGKAIKEYKEAIRIDPDYYFAHNNLGVLFQRKGMLDMAAKELKKTIQLKPGFDMAHNNLGNLYFELKEIPSASREYKEAIRLNPDNFTAHFNLGNMYYLSNRLDDAIKEYQAALAINPAYVEAYYRSGNTYNKMGRKEDAINHYERFIKAANKRKGFEQYIKTAKERMRILIQSRQ